MKTSTNKHRRCCKCKEILPLDKFYRDKNKPLGRHYICKTCDAKRTASVSTFRKREKWWRDQGIDLTWTQYEDIHSQQGGKCKLCLEPRDKNGLRGLIPDHCHKTGRVRGLICQKCNILLGRIETLDIHRIVNYLHG